jgi:hypothetical protein
MAIRCNVENCKFNDGGWCEADYLEIEDLRCLTYEEG